MRPPSAAGVMPGKTSEYGRKYGGSTGDRAELRAEFRVTLPRKSIGPKSNFVAGQKFVSRHENVTWRNRFRFRDPHPASKFAICSRRPYLHPYSLIAPSY